MLKYSYPFLRRRAATNVETSFVLALRNTWNTFQKWNLIDRTCIIFHDLERANNFYTQIKKKKKKKNARFARNIGSRVRNILRVRFSRFSPGENRCSVFDFKGVNAIVMFVVNPPEGELYTAEYKGRMQMAGFTTVSATDRKFLRPKRRSTSYGTRQTPDQFL